MKEQQIFSRIFGLFLVLYGFLMLSQPTQFGFGLQENIARLLAFVIILVGGYVTIRK